MKDNFKPYDGIVISSKADFFYVDIDISNVEINTKKIRLLCKQRNKLKYSGKTVYVGDRVLVERIDWVLNHGVICKVEERKNLFDRPKVANVSDVFILLSLSQPDLAFDQVNRFLLTAEQTGLDITLVLTKSDLISHDKINCVKKKLIHWGYNPIVISITKGQGINSLLKKLKKSKLAILSGPSGVGKSSLINYILPNQILPTSAVSRKLKRGRHTTRNVELFSLEKNSFVADTPGFNRPELQIEPGQLSFLFPEIRSQLYINKKICKFRNCLHRDEPGCVINKNWDRYSYYLEFLDQLINHSLQDRGDY